MIEGKQSLDKLSRVTPIPYSDTSKANAIVYPIFMDQLAYQNERWEEGLKFIRASLFSAASFQRNTNLIDLEIPIFYMIEDRLFERYSDMFSGISNERLLIFTAPESKVVFRRVGLKLMALTFDILEGYEQFLMIDTDMFACRKPDIRDRFDLSRLTGTNIGALYFNKLTNRGNRIIDQYWYYFNRWDIWGDLNDKHHVSKLMDMSESQLQSAYPHMSVRDPDMRYDSICGAVLRFPNPLPAGFKEFCLNVECLIGDDELTLILYSSYNNFTYDSLDSIFRPIAFNADEMLRFREQGPYFLHTHELSPTIHQTGHLDAVGLEIT